MIRAYAPPGKVARLLAVLALFVLALPGAAAGEGDRESEKKPLSAYDEAVDEAVDRALEYLAAQQLEDGSFPSGWKGNGGVASLCIMAFLARGHTPGVGPYGETINRAIDYILDQRKDEGMLTGKATSHGPMYSHSIATLMLSEVSGMVSPERQRKIDEALPRALEIILAAQQVSKNQRFEGGWRYKKGSRDADISCTGWPLMALRSARNSGAAVPKKAIEAGLGFVLRCRTDDGGFAYQPGRGAGLARTGTGLLALELSGMHRSEEALGAGDWILKHPEENYRRKWYYYGLYYTSQGMYQLGGDYWDQFARHMYETALPHQRDDGSWPSGGGNEGRAGDCYSTAMAALALSVSYCQLPIYQR